MSSRGIAIGTATVALLREHQGRQLLHQVELEGAYHDNDLVFPDPLGKPLDPSVLTHNFEKLTRRAGYPHLRLHDLRHAHAAGLIRVNTHPLVVAQRQRPWVYDAGLRPCRRGIAERRGEGL